MRAIIYALFNLLVLGIVIFIATTIFPIIQLIIAEMDYWSLVNIHGIALQHVCKCVRLVTSKAKKIVAHMK